MNLNKFPFIQVLLAEILNETAIRTVVGVVVGALVAQYDVIGPYSDELALIIAGFTLAVAGLIEWRTVPLIVAENRRPVVAGVAALIDLFEAKSGRDIPDDLERFILSRLENELANLANNANGGVRSVGGSAPRD